MLIDSLRLQSIRFLGLTGTLRHFDWLAGCNHYPTISQSSLLTVRLTSPLATVNPAARVQGSAGVGHL